jgi:proprotein convertase subtilisin/kexin type 5
MVNVGVHTECKECHYRCLHCIDNFDKCTECSHKTRSGKPDCLCSDGFYD